jgi:hypothetical protein
LVLGIIFAVKSERSQRIANQWLRYCTYSNFSYLLDPSDSEAQSPDFIQHRWEQSILSLILKSEKVNPILDETYFFPDWQKGSDFPIWAMRNRSGGDAARRNTFDIFKILTAKIERRILEFYRNFF